MVKQLLMLLMQKVKNGNKQTNKQIKIMESNQIFEQLNELWSEFSVEHSKPTKAAHNRARRALTGVKKLISGYKKASIAEDKS